MMRKIRLISGIVFWMLVFATLTNMAKASDFPIIKITCSGCYSSIEEAGIFYADVNKTVTFVGSATSDSNIVSQEWKTESGIILSQNAYLTVAVSESGAKYVFTAKDSKNRINSKTIEVQPRSQNICLPSFQISVSDSLGREEWAAGDTFYLEMIPKRKSCVYNLKWETKSPYVEITSPNSKKTQIKIKEGINAGYVKVSLTISNSLGAQTKEKELRIVSNIPPQVEAKFPDKIYSFSSFSVDCSESKEGITRHENDDFISKCTVSFAGGSNATATAKRGEALRNIRIYTGESGVYPLIVTVEDLHGKTSTKNYSIPVFMGTTGKDPIRIYAPNETYCLTSKVCRINAEETLTYDKRVSGFSFFLVLKDTRDQLKDDSGNFCSGPVCSHTFQYSGEYTVEIQGYTFKKEKMGFKTVKVVVGNILPVATLPQIPAKTMAAPALATPRPTFPEKEIEWKKAPKKSPSIETGVDIIVLLGIWAWRKKLKKFRPAKTWSFFYKNIQISL